MRKELDVWIAGERVGALSQGDVGALSMAIEVLRSLRDAMGKQGIATFWRNPIYADTYTDAYTVACFRQ